MFERSKNVRTLEECSNARIMLEECSNVLAICLEINGRTLEEYSKNVRILEKCSNGRRMLKRWKNVGKMLERGMICFQINGPIKPNRPGFLR